MELYDASKFKKHKDELDERISLMFMFQERQGGNLLLNRYGYSQTYVAQGLYKYYQTTGDINIKKARHKHSK